MNIAVYLGSNFSNSEHFRSAVCELGNWIGKSGHTLVYGGSKQGMMGLIADSVLDAGGKVIGVEPQFFIDKEYQHDGITQLIVTHDMAERKSKMIELSDAFIAFPGGLGTLDEISEIMCLNAIGQLDKPCILYNLDGFYDHLIAFFGEMKMKGLASDKSIGKIRIANDIEEISGVLQGSMKQ